MKMSDGSAGNYSPLSPHGNKFFMVNSMAGEEKGSLSRSSGNED